MEELNRELIRTTRFRRIVNSALVGVMLIPGAKLIGRSMTLRVTRSPGIGLVNRVRAYNLLADKVAPASEIDTTVAIPEEPSLSVRLRLGLDDELSRFWYFFGYDRYEVAVRRILAVLLESLPAGGPWHVLDVGGNIGYFSLFLGTLAKARNKARVHAFEPSPRVFNLLRRNLSLNPGLPVTLNDLAVSDVAGEFQLFLADEGFGHSSASLVPGAVAQKGALTVKTIALDDYVAGLGYGKIAILKMDCEGVETKVLAGFAKTLERDSPHIVLEILPRYPNMPSELAALPFFSRYRKFQITDAGLIEHGEIRPNYDNRDWLLSVDPPIDMIRSSFD
jgi:FkbM family methyltransferase